MHKKKSNIALHVAKPVGDMRHQKCHNGKGISKKNVNN